MKNFTLVRFSNFENSPNTIIETLQIFFRFDAGGARAHQRQPSPTLLVLCFVLHFSFRTSEPSLSYPFHSLPGLLTSLSTTTFMVSGHCVELIGTATVTEESQKTGLNSITDNTSASCACHSAPVLSNSDSLPQGPSFL